MLLRRLTEHVRAQNWFAVGLDFVIVVLGVFMATQVANWNEARQDREREQVYIDRLQGDFEAIEARSEAAMDVWQSAVDASVRLLNDFDTFDPSKGPVRPAEAIAADLGALRAGRIPATQAPTFGIVRVSCSSAKPSSSTRPKLTLSLSRACSWASSS